MTVNYNNVINLDFIDYIIKSYVPDIQLSTFARRLNINIFKKALIHSSIRNNETYERLEYLGDAIFHMIITDYLYNRYEDNDEGFLTKLRIKIEKGDSMAELSKYLKLDKYVQIHGIHINDHILEDIFESFVGAFYLNFGMQNTKKFIVKLIEKHKDLSELISHEDNYKDLLMRYYHQKRWDYPIYLKNEKSKAKFSVMIKTPNNKIIGIGNSNSKKKAEQLASKNALINLGVLIDNEVDPNWIDKIVKEPKEEKSKNEKKALNIYNDNNILISKNDIIEVLNNYNLQLNKFKLHNFKRAMTHKSYLLRKDKITKVENSIPLQKKSNERLQFLGVAIIHFVIGEHVYHKYNDQDEGFLTRIRCKLENRENLFLLAKKTGVDKYILISQSIELLHGRENVNIVGGGFEAFIGALFLECGINATRDFIVSVLNKELDINKIVDEETNYKDVILQIYNKYHWGQPDYKVIKIEGPDHSKFFTIGIYLKDKIMGKGVASSKKKAEQLASKEMYEKIKEQNKI